MAIEVSNWDVLITPQGRKPYKNRRELEKAWNENADFVHGRTGVWLSQREIKQYAPQVERVIIRYGERLEKTFTAWVREGTKGEQPSS